MAYKTILVTGSSGLIGSEAVEHFDRQGHRVVGVDNNMRACSSAAAAIRCGIWTPEDSTHAHSRTPASISANRDGVEELFRANRFDLIIHCAAQPSHDKASTIAVRPISKSTRWAR